MKTLRELPLVAGLAAVALSAIRLSSGSPPGATFVGWLAPNRHQAEPFTCPMEKDAEVRADDSGRCPKCGMWLVQLSRAAHAGEHDEGSPGSSSSSAAGRIEQEKSLAAIETRSAVDVEAVRPIRAGGRSMGAVGSSRGGSARRPGPSGFLEAMR